MPKSPAWITLFITLIGALMTFVVTRSTVEASTDARVTTLEVNVPAMEQRLTDRMDQNKDELRDDIKELRGLILNRR